MRHARRRAGRRIDGRRGEPALVAGRAGVGGSGSVAGAGARAECGRPCRVAGDGGDARRPDGREGFTFGAWPPSELFPVKSVPETRPAVDAPPKLSGVLTVGDAGVGGRNFATLAAASSAAESGDIIELRYNGRREEKPILLPNAKLVIRAGQGFQPVVVFRPNDPDPVKYPRTMFSLTGSELALLNVAIELDIPRDVPADRWTLLELGRAEIAAAREVFADDPQRLPPGGRLLPRQDARRGRACWPRRPPRREQAAKITLTDCIVRGEAVVVRAESLQPVHFAWTNGLLLTSEQLLWAAGGDTMPGPGQDIQVQLKHLTATVEAGLCRLDNRRFAKYQLPTQVDCSDSILMASVDSPLVEQIGEKSPEGSRPLFAWNGDRNFYQGFIVFWKVDDLDPEHAVGTDGVRGVAVALVSGPRDPFALGPRRFPPVARGNRAAGRPHAAGLHAVRFGGELGSLRRQRRHGRRLLGRPSPAAAPGARPAAREVGWPANFQQVFGSLAPPTGPGGRAGRRSSSIPTLPRWPCRRRPPSAAPGCTCSGPSCRN